MDNKILMKHNDLINAKYETRLIHNRVFVFLLYSFQKCKNSDELIYEVPRKELSELMSRTNDKTIKGINNILNDLRKKDLFLVEELEDGSRDYIAGGFINNSTYNDKKDIFTIKADIRVHRLLHKYLESGYTPVNLEIWLSLRNIYSQRFYDLLRAWTGTKEFINYKVEYIRKVLLLENKYKQYTDFRKRVLIPAIEELNSTGYFEITFEEVRKGRSVDSINFHVKDLDKRKYFDNVIKPVEKLIEEKSNNINSQSNDNNIQEDLDKYEYIKYLDFDVFNKGTLRQFKKDFKDIDFREKYNENAFDKAVMVALEIDDVEEITSKNYDYFKNSLQNQLEIQQNTDIESFVDSICEPDFDKIAEKTRYR